MRNKDGSLYRFNTTKLDFDYLLSVANYHNNSVITKINGQPVGELSGFTGSESCFDLPDVINSFPEDTEVTIECGNDGKQSLWNIFDALQKKGEIQRGDLSVNGGSEAKIFNDAYYIKNIDKHIVIDDSKLYVVTNERSDLKPLSDIGFDVDDGFYSTINQHPHADIIAELQNVYARFLAHRGLKIFTVTDAPLFNYPTEKQIDEFYKKEFGGTLFSQFSSNDGSDQSSEDEYENNMKSSP